MWKVPPTLSPMFQFADPTNRRNHFQVSILVWNAFIWKIVEALLSMSLPPSSNFNEARLQSENKTSELRDMITNVQDIEEGVETKITLYGQKNAYIQSYLKMFSKKCQVWQRNCFAAVLCTIEVSRPHQ